MDISSVIEPKTSTLTAFCSVAKLKHSAICGAQQDVLNTTYSVALPYFWHLHQNNYAHKINGSPLTQEAPLSDHDEVHAALLRKTEEIAERIEGARDALTPVYQSLRVLRRHYDPAVLAEVDADVKVARDAMDGFVAKFIALKGHIARYDFGRAEKTVAAITAELDLLYGIPDKLDSCKFAQDTAALRFSTCLTKANDDLRGFDVRRRARRGPQERYNRIVTRLHSRIQKVRQNASYDSVAALKAIESIIDRIAALEQESAQVHADAK